MNRSRYAARMKRGIAATAAAIALATAAPAAATPEDDYVNVLANTPGFTVNGFTRIPLTAAGNTICTDLRAGMTPEDSAAKMMAYPGATNVGIKQMVAAAQQTLCPDTLHP